MRPSARLTTLAFLAALATPAVLSAQDLKRKPHEFAADVGLVSTTGNSDVMTFNLGDKLIIRSKRWEHKQQFGYVQGSQNGNELTNLVYANWRSDFRLDDAGLAVFGYAGFDRNPFAGISRRFEESFGLAARSPKNSIDQWSFELGLGLTQQRAVDETHKTFSSVHSATLYKHFFSKAAYVSQAVEFLPNLETTEDYRVNTETAVVAPVSSHVSLRLGYTARFDNLPEVAKRKTDRIVTSGLQFSW